VHPRPRVTSHAVLPFTGGGGTAVLGPAQGAALPFTGLRADSLLAVGMLLIQCGFLLAFVARPRRLVLE
jgi:hypothetical protein